MIRAPTSAFVRGCYPASRAAAASISACASASVTSERSRPITSHQPGPRLEVSRSKNVFGRKKSCSSVPRPKPSSKSGPRTPIHGVGLAFQHLRTPDDCRLALKRHCHRPSVRTMTPLPGRYFSGRNVRFWTALMERDYTRAHVRVGPRVVFREPGGYCVHFRLRLPEGDLRPDSRDHVPPAAAANEGLVLRDLLRRHIDVARAPTAATPLETDLEVRRQYADHVYSCPSSVSDRTRIPAPGRSRRLQRFGAEAVAPRPQEEPRGHGATRPGRPPRLVSGSLPVASALVMLRLPRCSAAPWYGARVLLPSSSPEP